MRKKLTNANNVKHRPQMMEAICWLSRLLTVCLLMCWKGVSGCPGVEHHGLYYVSSLAELQNQWSCMYSTFGASYDESSKIISEFSCDHHSGQDCRGYVVNPNYVFWNDTVKDFIPAPWCEANVTSCSDLGSVCVLTSSSTCKEGEFVCKSDETQEFCLGSVVPFEPSDVVECPETVSSCNEARSLFPSCECENDTYFTCWDDYQKCKGKIFHPLDMTCPPDVVFSFDEVNHYCTKGSLSSGTDYECYWYGETVCKGTIDMTLQPPPCHHNISSCSQSEYYGLCERGGEISMSCGPYVDVKPLFQCMDKESRQWCEAHVVPSLGSWENPTCPNEAGSCELLSEYGLSGCNCGTFNGEGTFECNKDGVLWCSGTITNHPKDYAPPDEDTSNHDSNDNHTTNDDTTGDDDIVVFGLCNGEPPARNHTVGWDYFYGSLVVIAIVAAAAILVADRSLKRKRLVAGRTILATDEAGGHSATVEIPK